MINVNFFKRTMKHHSILLVTRIHFAKLFKKYYLLGKKTMYHIWKISKIISSETRGNLTGRNETQSSEAHHNISTPPDSPPPNSILSPFRKQVKQTEIGSKEASACTKLGGIRTDNHFQRITEYWY